MYCKIVLEDGGLTVEVGSYSTPSHNPLPPAAKFVSQGDAHMTTKTQIKFWYYPLCVG